MIKLISFKKFDGFKHFLIDKVNHICVIIVHFKKQYKKIQLEFIHFISQNIDSCWEKCIKYFYHIKSTSSIVEYCFFKVINLKHGIKIVLT